MLKLILKIASNDDCNVFCKVYFVPTCDFSLVHIISSCTESLHMNLCIGNLSRLGILLDDFELG